MKTLTEADKIKRFFPMHSVSMVKNFMLIVHCILQSRTVCLYKCRDKVSLAMGNRSKVKAGSDYMRLIRFFRMEHAGKFITGIRQMLISIVEIERPYLIIDRSNWKIGSKNVNLLTLGGLLSGCFIPLHWVQLDKRGNSNVSERNKLLEYFICLSQWAGKSVDGMILLADREFLGDTWYEYLISRRISFVIRLRSNMYGNLLTPAGKKNFAPVLMQTCSTDRRLRGTNVPERTALHLCNC